MFENVYLLKGISCEILNLVLAKYFYYNSKIPVNLTRESPPVFTQKDYKLGMSHISIFVRNAPERRSTVGGGL